MTQNMFLCNNLILYGTRRKACKSVLSFKFWLEIIYKKKQFIIKDAILIIFSYSYLKTLQKKV